MFARRPQLPAARERERESATRGGAWCAPWLESRHQGIRLTRSLADGSSYPTHHLWPLTPGTRRGRRNAKHARRSAKASTSRHARVAAIPRRLGEGVAPYFSIRTISFASS